MNRMFDVLGWSVRVVTLRGVPWKIGFVLVVWMVFDLLHAVQMALPLADLLLSPVLPLVVMVVHAAAHVLATQVVGGSTHEVVVSALVERLEDRVPTRPGAVFWSSFAGPLASLLLAGALWTVPQYSVHQLASYSLLVGLANLLACPPFDGRRWWRGALWPLVGLARAGRITTVLGFLSAALILVYAVQRTDYLLLFCGITSLLGALYDYGHTETGYDPVLGTDPRIHGRGTRSPSWWERWRAARQARAHAHAEARAARDAELLDRLLAKVSAHGLPSLTEDERQQLHDISRRQRAS